MRRKKRILSMFFTVCFIVGMLPQTAFATEGAVIGTSGLCEHHTAHDDTCGYVEGIAEIPCNHEHTEDCYETTTSCTHEHTGDCYPVSDSSASGNESTPSDAVEPTECVHECSEESGCIAENLNCTHTEHDDTCGYAAAVEGHDCHYECAGCAVEAAAPDCTAEGEAALYENAATITGVSITVDGTTYTSGNVTITPDSSISYTVTGTNFAGLSADNILWSAPGLSDTVTSSYGWDIDTDAGTATCDYTNWNSWFELCNNFEVRYSNDGGENYVGTGIYLTYDDGISDATITGVSITVDGT